MVDQFSKDMSKISEFFVGSAVSAAVASASVLVVWLNLVSMT